MINKTKIGLTTFMDRSQLVSSISGKLVDKA